MYCVCVPQGCGTGEPVFDILLAILVSRCHHHPVAWHAEAAFGATLKTPERTNTPLNQKGVSHRGVGVGVGVADSLRQRVLHVVQHGLQVMPRQFDVQALINGLGIDVVFFRSRSLRKFDVLVLVGR